MSVASQEEAEAVKFSTFDPIAAERKIHLSRSLVSHAPRAASFAMDIGKEKGSRQLASSRPTSRLEIKSYLRRKPVLDFLAAASTSVMGE